MTRYEYDSVLAFTEALRSLESLNLLIKRREIADKDRHELLKEWVILGRFFFDSMGNVFKYAPPNIPAEIFPHFPDIITYKDYQAYLKRYLKPCDVVPRYTMKAHIPSADYFCYECGKPWTVKNCHEVIFDATVLRHPQCYHQYQVRKESIYFDEVFTEAGYQNVQFTDIKNPYCTMEFCSPWFNVVADGLPITIGNWRERLIIIICTDPRIDFAKLFPNGDVTKGKDYIHAWGRKKCLEYLKKIKTLIPG